jgi:cell shape-determining protein MreC
MEAPTKTKSRKSDKEKKEKKEKKAKKSGIRTKFMIESLRNDYYTLREENDRLRNLVSSNLPEEAADAILADCFDPNNAPKAKAASIDELASKLNTTNVTDNEDDDDDEDDL